MKAKDPTKDSSMLRSSPVNEYLEFSGRTKMIHSALEKVLKFWFYKMHRGAVRMVLGHAAGATALGSALYFASLGPSIMSETPLQASNHLYSAQTKKYPREKRRNTVSDDSLENLKERGYVVIDNVLSKEELKAARLEIKKVHFRMSYL